MTTADVIQQTREFIAENFLYTRPDYELGDSVPLLGGGIIDSMGVMELVQFIGDTFGIEVGDDEITEDHLGSLDRIAQFVSRKRGRDAFIAVPDWESARVA